MVTNNEFPNLIKVLNDYGKGLVENYKSALAAEGVNASGELGNSMKYIIDSSTKGRLEVNLQLAHYWKYIENGRKAGKWPPISAIEKWIDVKPVLKRPMKNGQLPTTKQLAYLIARKIGLEGYKGKGILQDRINNANTAFWDDIEEAIAKDLGIQVEVIFKEMGW